MRSVAALALVAGASAFAPMMSMDMGRRQVVQTAGAAAVAAPLLRPKEADAFFQDEAITPGKFEGFLSRAPVISIFDHRGCSRKGKEYRGERAGDQNDEMCVMVRAPEIKVSIETSRKYLQEVISYQAKAIDGVYDGQSPSGLGGGAFTCPTEGCK